MTALPSGTTHSRYNKQKRKTNYFQIQEDGSFKFIRKVNAITNPELKDAIKNSRIKNGI